MNEKMSKRGFKWVFRRVTASLSGIFLHEVLFKNIPLKIKSSEEGTTLH